jgi:hypothetical protein
MIPKSHVLGAAALLATTSGCGSKATPRHTVHGCSPFASNQCLAPFPNAWFEQPDASTATRYKVVFPDGALPSAADGTPLSPTLLGDIDGYSPATQIIAYFPQGIDATQLTPTPTTPIDARIPASISTDSPIVLLDVAARTRVPFFAELDANAKNGDGERQALLIHPMARLKNATRYVVAIRTTLRDATGHALAPEGQFAQWVQGSLPKAAALWEVSDRLDEDAVALAAVGVPKSALALAWDFDTASEASTTGQLIKMRDQALAAAPKGLGFTVQSVAEPKPADDANTYRVITGTFQAPSFEAGADPSPLALDAHGQPVMGAAADWPFTALIPRCAVTAAAPAPLLITGHGLFGSAAKELAENAPLLQELCMVGIGSDWLGVSSSDLGVITGKVLVDPNQFRLVTDRLEQAHVNFQVLTRLALNALASDAHFAVGGRPSYDQCQ